MFKKQTNKQNKPWYTKEEKGKFKEFFVSSSGFHWNTQVQNTVYKHEAKVAQRREILRRLR